MKVFFLLVTVMVAGISARCPRRDEEYVKVTEGRKCRKTCTRESDCKGALKHCICDGKCGNSCFNPDALCDVPDHIPNGKFVYEHTQLKVGHVGYFICNNGYQMKGESERRCNSDKKTSFADTPPICELNHCAPNPCQHEGTCISRINGYICFCRIDFDGRNCENDLKCSQPENKIVNGIQSSKRYVSGYPLNDDTVEYTCNRNHKLSGYQSITRVITSTCRNNQWHPSLDTLRCAEILCPAVSIDNGRTNPSNANRKQSVGTRVTFECNEDYRLTTSHSSVTCGEDGTWSDMIPSCEVTVVTPVKAIQDSNECALNLPSRFRQTNRQGTWTSGDQLTFKCDDDLKEVRGNDKLTCLSHGKWSGLFPECIYKQPNYTYVASNAEYIVYDKIKLNKAQAKQFCNDVGAQSLLIAYEGINRDNVIQILDRVGVPLNEYWLDIDFVGKEIAYSGCRLYRSREYCWKWSEIKDYHRKYYTKKEVWTSKWRWDDGHETTDQAIWRSHIDTPHHHCPVIGKELCAGKGKYCSVNRPCTDLKTVACQREVNPCNKYPCKNMGTCIRVGQSGYRCVCSDRYSGVNCDKENFCVLDERLPDNIIVKEEGHVTERGAMIWLTNTIIKFACVNEYERIQNNEALLCTEHGGWNSSYPTTCELYRCNSPEELENGQVFPTSDEYAIGTEITFTCDSGFIRSGSISSTCLETGEWNNPPPTCGSGRI